MEKYLNIIGLIINMAGSFMVYYHTPKIGFRTILYNKKEVEEKEEATKNSNQKIAQGMLILFIGFFFQLIALMF